MKKQKAEETLSLTIRDPSRDLMEAPQRFASWLGVGRVEDSTMYLNLGTELNAAKAIRKQLKAELDVIAKPINAGLKALRAKFNVVDQPIEAFENHAKSLLNSYEQDLRRAELVRAEKEAKKLEKKGDAQMAEDVRTAALVKPLAPALPGQSTYKVKRARVADQIAFLSAIVRHEVAPGIVQAMIDAAENKLSALAKTGVELPAGCEVYEEEIRRVEV